MKKSKKLAKKSNKKANLIRSSVPQHKFDRVRAELALMTKSRDNLAKLVNPTIVSEIHELRDRNTKLELAMVLTRQLVKLIRYARNKAGRSTSTLDAFESDLTRILGDGDEFRNHSIVREENRKV